jgi:hypothetical protein
MVKTTLTDAIPAAVKTANLCAPPWPVFPTQFLQTLFLQIALLQIFPKTIPFPASVIWIVRPVKNAALKPELRASARYLFPAAIPQAEPFGSTDPPGWKTAIPAPVMMERSFVQKLIALTPYNIVTPMGVSGWTQTKELSALWVALNAPATAPLPAAAVMISMKIWSSVLPISSVETMKSAGTPPKAVKSPRNWELVPQLKSGLESKISQNILLQNNLHKNIPIIHFFCTKPFLNTI